jgi:hypothetical protein
VATDGSLLERMGVPASIASPALLGFDFPIGIPADYAERAGIDGFAAWFRQLDPSDELFDVAGELSEVSLARPFFPRVVRTRSPGLKRLFHDTLGLESTLRVCDRAHCGRRAASELFWTLGPQAVGKAALAGWKDALIPALVEPAHRYAMWPFDGELASLLEGFDAVIVEAYPAEAYRQLGLRMGTRGTAKTSQDSRRADAPRLMSWCARHGVVPDDQLLAQMRDGFGTGKAGQDPFDAVAGLFAMIDSIERAGEPALPADPTIRRYEGWIFGRHGQCPAR